MAARSAFGPKRVALIGSGSWGSAMAKIVGHNVLSYPDLYHPDILMYVYEEIVNGKKLTEIINTDHENPKYLPETKLPANVTAVPDVTTASRHADILIFVLPHQFVLDTCKKLTSSIRKTALAVSLVKGFVIRDKGFELVSKVIQDSLGIHTAVLSGANLATECACEMYCEATLGVRQSSWDSLLINLFRTQFFRCRIVRNVEAVETCGAFKNVVGIGAGLIDGLGYGDNTKMCVFRLGLIEMINFLKLFLQSRGISTKDVDDLVLESCGIADLMSTCQGGRNRLLGEALIKSMKKRGLAGVDIRMLEKEIIRGQSFQGPIVAREIYGFLSENNALDQFPLVAAVHLVCTREVDPRNFIDCLRNHPEHMSREPEIDEEPAESAKPEQEPEQELETAGGSSASDDTDS